MARLLPGLMSKKCTSTDSTPVCTVKNKYGNSSFITEHLRCNWLQLETKRFDFNNYAELFSKLQITLSGVSLVPIVPQNEFDNFSSVSFPGNRIPFLSWLLAP